MRKYHSCDFFGTYLCNAGSCQLCNYHIDSPEYVYRENNGKVKEKKKNERKFYLLQICPLMNEGK